MVKASTDDNSQGDTGTGTGGGPDITKAAIAAGARAQHSRSFGGAIAALVSWFVLITGTNTVSATGRGAQVAGGDTAVNSSSAGGVDTTGAPRRPAGSAFSDQMLVPSELQFVFKTGTDNINGHCGAQIAGGAGSVIANGAPTVNTSGAGAINTTGALAQFSRTAAGAFSDKMLIQREFVFKSGTDRARPSGIVIKAKTINFGAGSKIAGDGAVIADGAAAVNTKNAAAVNIYE
jgi:hypothetical protein